MMDEEPINIPWPRKWVTKEEVMELYPAQQTFCPPPWSISENPEKTEGWFEFQRALRKDPEYYKDAVQHDG